jgi:hypothetical protein
LDDDRHLYEKYYKKHVNKKPSRFSGGFFVTSVYLCSKQGDGSTDDNMVVRNSRDNMGHNKQGRNKGDSMAPERQNQYLYVLVLWQTLLQKPLLMLILKSLTFS